jgi:SLAP domain-containing protein
LEKHEGVGRLTHRIHLVFVYGTLRMDDVNHHLLKEAELVVEWCWTSGKLYDTGLGYPVIVQDRQGKITGELYLVSDEELEKLDVLEGYSVNSQSNMYERITQTIHVESETYNAFVYVNASLIVSEDQKIDSGDWKEYRRRGMITTQKDNQKQTHKLVLQDTWDRAISDQDRKIILETYQGSTTQEGKIEFIPIRAGLNVHDNLFATVLIQNGSLEDMRFDQLKLLFEENNEIIAEELFTISELEILANTSTPWTFIFQKENVLKPKKCYDTWNIRLK